MVGFEEKTRHAEGGTRHALFVSVRTCPSRACNGPFLSVVCAVLSLKFAGVAVRVAVQANTVQQCLILPRFGRSCATSVLLPSGDYDVNLVCIVGYSTMKKMFNQSILGTDIPSSQHNGLESMLYISLRLLYKGVVISKEF
jgi:hypothetical protein